MRAIFFLLCLISLSNCNVPTTEELVELDEEIEALPAKADNIDTSKSIKVVQVNPFYNGKYTESDKSQVTWDTANRFAKLIRDVGQVGIIGLQETNDPHIRAILEEKTGYLWEIKIVEQGINGKGSGLAILWRPDLVEKVDDFGFVEVEKLDTNYSIRFMGMLLKPKGAPQPLGVFNGKLAWDGAELAGRTATDADRAKEASLLRKWIKEKMANYPQSGRLVTMDLNGGFNSAAWKKMNEEFDDHQVFTATHNSHNLWLSQRLDYIWFDIDGAAKKTGAFIDGPRRSMHFGSDHRFVWAVLKTTNN